MINTEILEFEINAGPASGVKIFLRSNSLRTEKYGCGGLFQPGFELLAGCGQSRQFQHQESDPVESANLPQLGYASTSSTPIVLAFIQVTPTGGQPTARSSPGHGAC